MTSSLADWTIRERPERKSFDGRLVRVEPLDAERHAAPMFDAFTRLDPEGRIWDYLPYGPYESLAEYTVHLVRQMEGDDPLFYTIIDKASGDAVGVASLMRIDPVNGVIEVGNICYTPRLQRTAASTEAMALLARYVFDELGYRRYEWKCNNDNVPSKRAAERLGFTFEGVFRQHMIVKRRNRDTAWFSMLDTEWPEIKRRFEAWLDPSNFNADGTQIVPLERI